MENKGKKSFKQRGKKGSKNKSGLSDVNARNLCDCEATKHPLVNNCINCGRIVCLSEGPGPCFFCGQEVTYENHPYSTPDLEHKNKNSKQTSNSIKLRDKLLDFDKNCASRTSVIDDESDYYQANNLWLTKEQREQWKNLESNVQEQKHKSRLQQKLSIDFTGRVQEEKVDPIQIFNQMNSIQDTRQEFRLSQNNFQPLKGPVYVGENPLPSNVPQDYDNPNYINNRIQDKGYLEISDQGLCLSMHQPYASLLVRGIKKTEGRTWYTSHRGRLWIASTAKEAKAEDVASIESMYRLLASDEVQFPKTYPTGCLIGCVTVTDVLSQEEYDERYPNDKVDSPYIFICENYFELPLKYPIQGKHKIYKLDPVIHRAASNCLEKTCLQMSQKS
ncbi:hypothetical protein QAD02_006272 [Eretmocerus hayati]|uniref:Uncharacterized protein n=1 Tax=Eretmocerus hayati TaxID=131215 RepID=A0ACC2N0G3_9HYME|nr:hypothetical protein QAD02_006272 [Eretmocerus hayati]